MNKQDMVGYAFNFIGTPYVWGGNDTSSGGMDCSGFVLECLRAKGLWGMSDTNAQGIYTGLMKAFKPSDSPQTGDLLFFGKSSTEITHVAIAVSPTHMIEAGGGSSTIKQGMIRLRPISWRRDHVKTLNLGD
jgi:peptidoglycan DL-endopeptidase CwlO